MKEEAQLSKRERALSRMVPKTGYTQKKRPNATQRICFEGQTLGRAPFAKGNKKQMKTPLLNLLNKPSTVPKKSLQA